MVMRAQGISFSVPKLGGSDFEAQAHPNPKKNTTMAITYIQSRRNHRRLCCRCTPSSSLHWDWNQWTCHFSRINQAESFASLLQHELEDAIENEDFIEAAKLKRAVEEATSNDIVAQIMSQLKNAIDDERYQDASTLCKQTGSGLVGWWVGYSKDSDDPLGRIIGISPGFGRFVGKSYSLRQLLTASPGTPIFEIYVVKNADDTYEMQVVHLQMRNPPSMAAKSPSKPEVENESSVEIEEKVEKNDETNNNIEGTTEEYIQSVINSLMDKIPGFKMKVMHINVKEEGAEDDDSIKQLMHEDSNKTSLCENAEAEVNNLDEHEHDEATLEADSDASTEEEKDLDTRLFVCAEKCQMKPPSNDNDTLVKDEFRRLPAEIQDTQSDYFVLHNPKRNREDDTRKHKVPEPDITVAALAAQELLDIMPSDVVKIFWGSDYYKVSSMVPTSLRELVKYAMSKVQERSRLSEYTSFSRITSSSGVSDPFDGIYVGAFGAYGTQVVQLKRKFGRWNDVDNENNPSDMEFCEYVEAVKLIGDLNVPAGQVTFRAKIGGANRKFPNELGVDAIYKGQGRVAEFGFQNPRWVDGKLLLLNGKCLGPFLKGGDIGFLYDVPERSFIVLFCRLKLPEF